MQLKDARSILELAGFEVVDRLTIGTSDHILMAFWQGKLKYACSVENNTVTAHIMLAALIAFARERSANNAKSEETNNGQRRYYVAGAWQAEGYAEAARPTEAGQEPGARALRMLSRARAAADETSEHRRDCLRAS